MWLVRRCRHSRHVLLHRSHFDCFTAATTVLIVKLSKVQRVHTQVRQEYRRLKLISDRQYAYIKTFHKNVICFLTNLFNGILWTKNTIPEDAFTDATKNANTPPACTLSPQISSGQLMRILLLASWCGFSYWPAEWGSPIGPLTRVLFFASWLGFSYWPADFSYWSPADSSSFLCQLIQVLLLASWSKFSYWPNESSPLIGQRMESIPFARLFSFSSCPAFSEFLALQYYCIIGYWFLRYCHFKKNIYLVHSGSERMLACWTVELCWWLGQLLDTKLLV